MRYVLLLLAVTVPAGAVTPFSWEIRDQGLGTPDSVTIPTGMFWVVEQVTGYESSARVDALVVGVTPTLTSSQYPLILGPSYISHVVQNNQTYYYADYSRPVTARFSGTIYARSINGQTLPRLLALTGYLTPTLAGDYSGDGAVNAADYTVLRDNAAAWETSDLVSWRSNYGGSASAAVSVPEPSALLLTLAAMLTLARGRRG